MSLKPKPLFSSLLPALMIVLAAAGSGHVRRGGIPAQVREWRREVPVVILTAEPNAASAEGMTREDADFLLRLP